ncbi:hypothetical protein ABTN67_22745, partial [Acinetobacter baumannii]
DHAAFAIGRAEPAGIAPLRWLRPGQGARRVDPRRQRINRRRVIEQRLMVEIVPCGIGDVPVAQQERLLGCLDQRVDMRE